MAYSKVDSCIIIIKVQCNNIINQIHSKFFISLCETKTHDDIDRTTTTTRRDDICNNLGCARQLA